MKEKTKNWPVPRRTESLLLKEAVVMGDLGLTIPVRVAKAKLSALLELVAAGQEVTITSDGKAKAVLSPAGSKHGRRIFTGMGDFLLKQPVHGGPPAEAVVREDRDARGW